MADADFDRLMRVPLFAGLSEKDLKRLGGMLEEHTFADGEQVAVEDQTGLGFFFLIDAGGATVSRGGETLNTLGPGDWFGELALIAKGPRTATVTAAGELRCRTLAAFQFRPFVKEHGEVAWKLLEALTERLRGAESAGLGKSAG